MRYVVKSKSGEPDPGALDKLAAIPGVEIVDRIGDWAALVEASDAGADRLRLALPTWLIVPETGISRPAPPFPRPAWKVG